MNLSSLLTRLGKVQPLFAGSAAAARLDVDGLWQLVVVEVRGQPRRHVQVQSRSHALLPGLSHFPISHAPIFLCLIFAFISSYLKEVPCLTDKNQRTVLAKKNSKSKNVFL